MVIVSSHCVWGHSLHSIIVAMDNWYKWFIESHGGLKKWTLGPHHRTDSLMSKSCTVRKPLVKLTSYSYKPWFQNPLTSAVIRKFMIELPTQDHATAATVVINTIRIEAHISSLFHLIQLCCCFFTSRI